MSAEQQQPQVVQAVAVPPGEVQQGGKREGWLVDLCSCWCEIPAIFCFSCCCNCVGLARSAGRSGLFNYKHVLYATFAIWLFFVLLQFISPALGGFGAILNVIGFIVAIAVFVFAVVLRIRISDKYKTGESGCVSCLCMWCCFPCALGQQMQHVDIAEYGKIDNGCHLRETP